jgi:hypothetical protein
MTIKSTGPLFKKGDKIIKGMTEQFAQRMMELGEQRLDSVLRPKPLPGVYLTKAEAQPGLFSTGHYRRNVIGKRQGLEAIITDSGVEYGPWLESGRGRPGRRFKGYRAFGKTKEWLNSQMKSEAKDYTKRYVKKLNGR